MKSHWIALCRTSLVNYEICPSLALRTRILPFVFHNYDLISWKSIPRNMPWNILFCYIRVINCHNPFKYLGSFMLIPFWVRMIYFLSYWNKALHIMMKRLVRNLSFQVYVYNIMWKYITKPSLKRVMTRHLHTSINGRKSKLYFKWYKA